MKPRLLLILAGVMTCSLSAQPVNDNPCNAIALPVNTSCEVSDFENYGATNTWGIAAPPCGPSAKDVWFSAVVPPSGMFTIETFAGTITDAILSVYTGTCDDLSFGYCNDNNGVDLMPMLKLKGFIPGSTVYIRFYRKGGGTGTFSLCVWDNNPPLGKNNDCSTAQLLCTDAPFTANSGGPGEVDDLTATNKGCLTPNEHATSWYYFTIGHPGELTITITPLNPTDNYDFAIWGPTPVCPPAEPPMRCSASNTTGATGISTTYFDPSEGAEGDGWVKFIDVDVGQTYLLMIDNTSGSGSGFTMNFTGPPTISCSPFTLPVTITGFEGYAEDDANVLNWTAESQLNNAWFVIERAASNMQFQEIGRLPGAGTINEPIRYTFTDQYPIAGTGYYRLKLIDLDGKTETTQIIEITNGISDIFSIAPNPSDGVVHVYYNVLPETAYTLEVVNTQGQTMHTFAGIAHAEEMQTIFSIEESGIYFIILNDGNIRSAKKLVVY